MKSEEFVLQGYAQSIADLSVDLMHAIEARTAARKAHRNALRDYGWEPGDSYEVGEDDAVDRTEAFKYRIGEDLTKIRKKHRSAVIRYRNLRAKVIGE